MGNTLSNHKTPKRKSKNKTYWNLLCCSSKNAREKRSKAEDVYDIHQHDCNSTEPGGRCDITDHGTHNSFDEEKEDHGISALESIHARVVIESSTAQGSRQNRCDEHVQSKEAPAPVPTQIPLLAPGLATKPGPNKTDTVLSHRVTNISNSHNFTTVGNVEANVLNIYQGQDNFTSEHIQMWIATAESYFVKTRAFHRALEEMTSHDLMTIVGPSGAGKTTLSLVVAHHFQQKGFSVHFNHNLFLFNFQQLVDPRVPTLLIFDDMFGSHEPQTSIDHYLHVFQSILSNIRLHTKSNEGMKLKVIITSKSDIFETSLSLMPRVKELFSTETMLDLADFSLNPTVDEKIEMLELHFRSENGHHPKKSELSEMVTGTKEMVLGFPGLCRLFVRNYNKVSNVETFFENPHQFLKPEIERLMCGKNSISAAIILMVLCNGQLNLMDFGTVETRQRCGLNQHLLHLKEFLQDQYLIPSEITSSLRHTKGIFSVSAFDEVTFTHPFVYECAAVKLGKMNPTFVLKHCNFHFIHEHVILHDLFEKDHISTSGNMGTINITNNYFQLFSERLSDEIKLGNIALAFTHQGLSHKRVVDVLFDHIKGELKILIHKADKEFGHHLLYWATFSKSKYFFETLLKYSSPTNREKVEAVLGCCLNGNESALTLLIPKLGSSVIQLSQGKLSDILNSSSQNDFPEVRTLSEDMKTSSMTLISVAKEYGHENIVRILEETTRKENVEAALHSTAKFKEDDIVAAIGGDITSVSLIDTDGDSFLHAACAYGQLDFVKSVLSSGDFDMELKGRFDRTLIMTAVTNGEADVFEYLLERGADITLTDSTNNNLLHLACIKGNLKIIQRLVQLELYDINSRGYELWTPLHFAVINGQQHIFDFLLHKGADLNMYCENDNNGLHLAAKKGHLDVIKWLCNTKAFDVNAPGESHHTPMAFAAENGHLKVIKFLLTVGADPSIMTKCGCHCLHLASNHGHLDIVKHFVAGGYIDIEDRGGHTFSPLLSAVRNNCEKVVEYLIRQGAKTKQSFKDDSSLHIACALGSVSITKLLLATKEFDLNQRGTQNRTPLMQAIAAGQEEMQEYLLSIGARYDLDDSLGMNCLHLACEAGSLSLVTKFVEEQVFDVTAKGNGMSPIQIVCQSGQYAVFEYLLSQEMEIQDDILDLIKSACIGGSRETLIKLFHVTDEAVDLDYQDPSHNYWSLLMCAAHYGNAGVVEELAKRGANIRLRDKDGDSALHLACIKGHIDTVKLLVTLDKNTINCKGQHGSTPLMLACYHRQVDVFRYLHHNNADTTVIDRKGYSCIHLACMGGKLEIIKLLLNDFRIQINIQDKGGYSPIMWATQCKRPEAVAYLILQGADLNLMSDNGQSCLKLVCHSGRIEIVDLIVRTNKVDINETGGSTWTPLMNACLEGHQLIVDYLLERGADVSIRSKEGALCLHIACMGGNILIVKKLLEIGQFHVDMRGENDWTPLMLAARDGHYDLFVELLKMKANPKLTNKYGDTCIHLAIDGGHLNIV